jgi:hypothetical protein
MVEFRAEVRILRSTKSAKRVGGLKGSGEVLIVEGSIDCQTQYSVLGGQDLFYNYHTLEDVRTG